MRGGRTALAAATATVASALLAAPAQAPAAFPKGIIVTVAGDGTVGAGGDGGLATMAQLSSPTTVFPTPAGGFLIADQYNHEVREVFANGNITKIAGLGPASGGYAGDGGPANAAELDYPAGVAVTPDGNTILIADGNNACVRGVSTSSGKIKTVAGTCTVTGSSGNGGPAKLAKLRDPTSIAPLRDGSYLIADTNASCIRRVSAGGTISTAAGKCDHDNFGGDGGHAAQGHLREPFGVAATPDGGYLIADVGDNRIRRVSATGIITTIAGNGIPGFSGDGGSATSAKLQKPAGVSPTADGGFLIADEYNDRIRKVSASGKIKTVVGDGTNTSDGDGGQAINARISFPTGVFVLPSGGYLIADRGGQRVRYVVG